MAGSLKGGLLAVALCFAATVQATPVITACGHHDYAPWNWRQQGEIVGACAAISKELFARLGYQLQLTYTGPWARCQQNIREGKVDVNICSVINPQRQQYASFTRYPVGFNENAIFVRRGGEFTFEHWPDLAGRRAGMVRGVRIDSAFDDFVAGQPDSTRVNSYRQLFDMLRRGRIDYVPVGRLSGRAMLEKMGLSGDIVDLPTPVLTAPLHISISRQSPYRQLIPQLDALLQAPDFPTWRDRQLAEAQQLYAAGPGSNNTAAAGK